MILKMILKSFEFQCDFDFQITTSKMIWILILNHLYLGHLILILKSSTYDDFSHLWSMSTTRAHGPLTLSSTSILLADEECMAGRVLKRIVRENVNVSLTLPASLPCNREFAPRCGTQSVEKSDSLTGALCN